MKNITRVFLDSAPVRTRLKFGVNSPVVLKSVSNTKRRDKNNLKIDRSFYMRFAKLNKDDNTKIEAETEFSYFGLNKKEYAAQNFIHQYQQMMEIFKYTVPPAEQAKHKVDITAAVMTDVETMMNTKKAKSTNKVPSAALHAKMRILLETIADAMVAAISPYVGLNGAKLNLLVVTGPNGKFLDLPKEEVGFINLASSDTKLRIEGKYHVWYSRKDEDEKAAGDVLGESLDIESDELDLGGEELDLGGEAELDLVSESNDELEGM